MKKNHSFRVDYSTPMPDGDITIFVLKEDMDEVRELIKRVVIVCDEMNLDEAKVEMAAVIGECLQADNDAAYLIGLINTGHAPYSWYEDGEEILYAEEDPDNEEQILLYVRAKSA